MTIAVKCDTVGGKLGQHYRENQKSDPQVKETRLLTQNSLNRNKLLQHF